MECPVCQAPASDAGPDDDSTRCATCRTVFVIPSHGFGSEEPPTPFPWSVVESGADRFRATKPWRSAALLFLLVVLVSGLAFVTAVLATRGEVGPLPLTGAALVVAAYGLAAGVANRSCLVANADSVSYGCEPLPFPMPARISVPLAEIRALAFIPKKTLSVNHGRSVQTPRVHASGYTLDVVMADGTRSTLVPSVATEGQRRWLAYWLRKVGSLGRGAATGSRGESRPGV